MTNTSTHGAPSLRERLIDYMNVRRLSRATQRKYVRDVPGSPAGWAARWIRDRPALLLQSHRCT